MRKRPYIAAVAALSSSVASLSSPATAWATGGGAGEAASSQDPVSQTLVALVLAFMFVGLVRERAHRVLVVLSCVVFIFAVSYLTPFTLMTFGGAMNEAMDWNVIFLLAAMMAIVGVLKETNVFPWAVGYAMKKTKGEPSRLIKAIIHLTGFLSAFADNVTTVLFVTPMATRVAATLGVSAWAILMPSIMAANIGGTATLIGDPPNIMIGSAASLDFMDFILNLTAPVVVMMFVLEKMSLFYYRKDVKAAKVIDYKAMEEVPIRNPHLLKWALWIVAMVFVGFATHGLTHMPVAVPAMIGAGLILWLQDHFYLKHHKPTLEEREHGVLHVMEKEIEWPVLVFFVCLFIVVGAAVSTGLMGRVADGLGYVIDHSALTFGLSPRATLLLAALIVLFVSAVASAFLDNIPYTLVSIPVVAALSASFQSGAYSFSKDDAEVLWWALALGACLGGNGTLTGASANVTVVGIAEKAGNRIGFLEFMRFGMPVMLLTTLIGAAFVVSYIMAGATVARFAWAGLAVVMAAWSLTGAYKVWKS
jgi:Na+/H+ antiporter NhaD/arsenite permease-like protein